jgi:hypothetical protein
MVAQEERSAMGGWQIASAPQSIVLRPIPPESRHTKLSHLGRTPRVLNHKHTSRMLVEG